MVDVGSIIRAKVTRVEPYGVFLQHGKESVVVLVPETSWSDRRPLPERIRPGEEYDVLVLRYNYRDGTIVGSMRRLHPELNPYRKLAQLEPGTILRGKVVNVLDAELTVELPSGAWGHVPWHDKTADVRRGDELDLAITAVEADEGRLLLEQIATASASVTGPARRQPVGPKS
jgi:ribosomal protein S1